MSKIELVRRYAALQGERLLAANRYDLVASRKGLDLLNRSRWAGWHAQRLYSLLTGKDPEAPKGWPWLEEFQRVTGLDRVFEVLQKGSP